MRRGQPSEGHQDQGLGQHGQAVGVTRIVDEPDSRKGAFSRESGGMEVSVVWLEQRTCSGRQGVGRGQRGAEVRAGHQGDQLQEPSLWGQQG